MKGLLPPSYVLQERGPKSNRTLYLKAMENYGDEYANIPDENNSQPSLAHVQYPWHEITYDTPGMYLHLLGFLHSFL